MQNHDEFLDDLNELLSLSRDAQKGYTDTYMHVSNKALHEWMRKHSEQRKQFTDELAAEIKRLGGDPDKDTSLLGELHRLWIDIKGSASSDDAEAMLEECERGEEKAVEEYGEMLEEHADMPASTRSLLVRQKSQIQTALANIRTLKGRLEAAD